MSRRPRFYLIMAMAVTAAYGLLYFNGARNGFTRGWFAGAFLGTPFFFIVWAMYRPDLRRLEGPSWAFILLGLLAGLLLFVGYFDFLGWAGLAFVAILLILALYEVDRRRSKSAPPRERPPRGEPGVPMDAILQNGVHDQRGDANE